MTEIISHSQPHSIDMKLNDFAKHIGKHERTVRTWLDQGELPAAYKDKHTGHWMFPPSAMRVLLTPAERDEYKRRMAEEEAAGQGLVVSPANRELVHHELLEDDEPVDDDDDDDLTMGQKLDRAKLFLTIREASKLLGVPMKQIKDNPEYFEAQPIGYGDSLLIPKYVLRRFEGKS